MGTIAAVAPIAVEMSLTANIPMAVSIGAIVSGAFFGDNLSMISDTTIAATRTQGCKMKDKFLMNFKIAIPAAIITIIIMVVLGTKGTIPDNLSYTFINIIPYLTVLIMALLGVNVFVVLLSGTALAGIIGLVNGSFTFISYFKTIYTGYEGMMEIFLLSMLIGGLANMMADYGGIAFLLRLITTKIKSSKGAELGIALLVSISNICTANNTVAIILTGSVAKEISDKYDIAPKRSASILDIYSCVIQGTIPYGAQLLLAGSIAQISPVSIMPYLFYPILLGIITFIAIFAGFPKSAIKKSQHDNVKISINK